jgi:hypothetical protein
VDQKAVEVGDCLMMTGYGLLIEMEVVEVVVPPQSPAMVIMITGTLMRREGGVGLTLEGTDQ